MSTFATQEVPADGEWRWLVKGRAFPAHDQEDWGQREEPDDDMVDPVVPMKRKTMEVDGSDPESEKQEKKKTQDPVTRHREKTVSNKIL